jgi:hypothetical protein
MILFAPAYDDSTHATCRVARRFASRASAVFLEQDATRENLVAQLRSGTWHDDVVAFSHGTTDTLKAQHSATAVSAGDVPLFSGRGVFAFACHTGTGLGGAMAEGGVAWWGYTGVILAPAGGEARDAVFGPVFEYLVDTFLARTDHSAIHRMFSHLRLLCHEAERLLDSLFDAGGEVGMEDYKCLLHIWDRLRVWLPGRRTPEFHPDSTPLFVVA